MRASKMRALFFALAMVLCTTSLIVSAQVSSVVDRISQVDVASEIAAALFAASATQEAAERQADQRIGQQRAEIEELRLQLVLGEKETVQTELAELREQLSRREMAFVAKLAESDRAYAQEIAVFRNAVENIASTPEGLTALALFNDGDEIGAIAILDDLAGARDESRKAANKVMEAVAKAKDLRTNALFALEARSKGKLTTADLITRYEEITRLDPDVHWDWVELTRLYFTRGSLVDAEHAALMAAARASDDRDKSVSLNELGDVYVAQGNLPAALKSFEDGLGIARRLSEADPSNAGWQRDVWVSLWRLKKFPDSGVRWSDIVKKMEAMQVNGILLNGDARFLEMARANASIQVVK